MKKSVFTVISIVLFSIGAKSQPIELPVWPKGAPNSNEIANAPKVENGKFAVTDPMPKSSFICPKAKVQLRQ